LSQPTARFSLVGCFLALASLSLPAAAQLPLAAPEPEAPPIVAPAPEDAPSQAAPSVVTPPGVPGPLPAPSAAPLPAPPSARAPAKVVVIREPTPALDDDDDDDDVPALAPRRVWYGWQTLVVDAAGLSGLVLSAALSDSGASDSDVGALATFGLLSYELGPGIVHFVHRNPGRGFASFGMRLGLPLAGAFVGASVSSNCDGFLCEADGAAAGLLLGMAGAIAIDAAVFAYDDRRPRRARAKLVPVASFVPGRAWLGLAGEL
jgi:hypothetical protein